MRHRNAGKKLGRSPSHRAALARNFLCSVIKHERVETTLAIAKGLRPKVEKMITLGKRKSLAQIRRAAAQLRDAAAVKKLFDELGPRYANRPGGYTRVIRLSGYRIGDGGRKAILELVDNKVLERKLQQATAELEKQG
jgi:large subunit ribosomal protein L17